MMEFSLSKFADVSKLAGGDDQYLRTEMLFRGQAGEMG